MSDCFPFYSIDEDICSTYVCARGKWGEKSLGKAVLAVLEKRWI
jgi:hypothetical protein